ncbi:MAG: hypothetical protein RLZZ297_32 [Chloroflexota bacterium]|jgi:signal transduction histidine kinase
MQTLRTPPTASTWFERHRLVWHLVFIMALPAALSLLTTIALQLLYGETNWFPPHLGQRYLWLLPAVPITAISLIAYAFLRFGQPTISAVILMVFWTIATTGMLVRFGAMTNFPALLVVPIAAASLLFHRRITVLMTALSCGIVAFSGFMELRRPSYYFYDALRGRLITDPVQVQSMGYAAIAFWIGIYCAVAVITMLLAQSLHASLRQTAAHAEALERLSSDLEERVQTQTASLLAGEREQAMLAERTRLAREIHDTLAQGLTGIIVQIGAAQQAQHAGHPDAAEHLDIAGRMAREALAEARRSVWNLRTGALERGDLRDALRTLVAKFRHPSLTARYTDVGVWQPVGTEVESALLRVAQESLANAARHSGAATVSISLERSADHVRLTIRDDGCGFGTSLTQITPEHQTFGILGMRERIAALNGELTLHDDHGAVVTATVTVAPAPDGDAA